MKLLFVCGRNKRRSPTAEEAFTGIEGIEVRSAGVSPDAETPLDAELIEWADVIFVMERIHREKMNHRFSKRLRRKKIVCLGVPDVYEHTSPELVRLLWRLVPRSVPGLEGMEPPT